DSASQFPLGAVFGHAWVLAGLCGLTHLFASSLDRGKSTRTGSLGTQARCGSRRGTFGASPASALGLCAQPAYTRFVRSVTSSAVVTFISKPTSPLEEGEQDRERDELCADAHADERLPAADAPDQVAEVLTEEAGE